MYGLVLDLFLGSGHEVAHAHLGIFRPVGFNIDEFVVEQLAVEAGEEGQQEVLLSLHPEVGVGEVEGPRPGRALGEHEEVFGGGDEAHHAQPAQEDQGLPAGEAEVLVVGGDGLCASEF